MNKALKKIIPAVTAAAVSFSSMLAFDVTEMTAAAADTTGHSGFRCSEGDLYHGIGGFCEAF